MISIKTEKEIEIMEEGGKVLAKIMKELKKSVRPGMKTLDLEKIAQSLIKKARARCSFKGYREGNQPKYPACLCTSINEEIVHVPPSNRILKEGDVLKLDLGIFWKGYHLDKAITISVGKKISPEIKNLISVTKKALDLAIKKLKPGISLREIGEVIQNFVEKKGMNVIRELCGHGIGRELHEDPKVLNFKGGRDEKIQEGMVLCVEPMVSLGDWHLEKTKDGFGYKTKDNSLTAHFEDTVAVTKRGPKILTR